jgi:hypothetical protein
MRKSESAYDPDIHAEESGNAQRTIKEGMINGFQVINQVEAGLVDLARHTVSDTMKATGAVANEALTVASDVFRGVIAAAREAGLGLLDGTKSIAKGIIFGVSGVGGDVKGAAAQTARDAVKGAADVGADVAIVAKRTVDGIVEAAAQAGANVNEVARAAVNGAIEAAGSVGENAVKAVSGTLTSVVSGIRDIEGRVLPPRNK